MDFAKNYTCQSVQEVQLAYWNASMVTLYPAVAQYRSEDQQISHKSMVFVSDKMGHNSSTVFAFLKELMPQLKTILPNIKHINFHTDSPTSHYRNKTIFYLLSHDKNLFDVSVSQNYFKAVIAKGSCEGVGGSVKNMAGEAVRQQKLTIQDTVDFLSWTQHHQSASSVSFTLRQREPASRRNRELIALGKSQLLQGQ